MADSIYAPIRKAAKIFPLTLGEVHQQFLVLEDGSVHSTRANCYAAYQSTGGVRKYVELTSLRAKTTCDTCLRAYHFGGYMGKRAGFLQNCVDATEALVKSRKETGGDMRRILALQKKLVLVQKEVVHYQGEVHPEEKKVVENLLQDLNSEHRRLELLLRSPEETQRVLSEVQEELVGEVDPEYVFDETPTLVAIHPYVPTDWNQIVLALVKQCSAQESPLVLQVPRYVADYLATLNGARRHGLQLSANAEGVTPEILELALGVWDPQGTAALSSLAGALTAARAL